MSNISYKLLSLSPPSPLGKAAIGFLSVFFLLFGCKSKTACIAEQQIASAQTLSIAGTDHLNVGEQATITVGIRNNLLTCVKEGKATFTNIGFDSLLVTSELVYTNDPVTMECDCKTDSIVYTLIYFKPLDKGTYYFLTQKKDSSVTSLDPSNVLGFTITAD